MNAAKTSSTEAVAILLRGHADPDIVDEEGWTALSYALKTNNVDIIKRLAPITIVGIDTSISLLAMTRLRMDRGLEFYVKDILASNRGEDLLKKSSFFGNTNILDYLLKDSHLLNKEYDYAWSEDVISTCLENVIKSDNVEACKIVLNYWKNALKKKETHFEDLIRDRGNNSILKLFEIEEETQLPNDLLQAIPKSEDFTGCTVVGKIVDLVLKTKLRPEIAQQIGKKVVKGRQVKEKRVVSFETLLEDLHVPPVHFKEEDIGPCIAHCHQKIICKRIREVKKLLDQILTKMSRRFKIFEDVSVIIVGSLKEGTKIGDIDEADVTLALSEDFQIHLEFDRLRQKIMVRKYFYNKLENNVSVVEFLNLPDKLKPFVCETDADAKYFGSINTSKYFFTFMEEFYNTIKSGTLQLPEGLSLSTEFTPCDVCRNTDHTVAQYVRCKHEPGCQEHSKRLQNPDYKEECRCRNFTSPCLSYSKIGLVLHLEFVNSDGSLLNLDVDINPPSFPVSKGGYKRGKTLVEDPDYDGGNTDKRSWLEQHRPVGWRTEWDKSEDMSDAAGPGDGLRRAVRLRFFNHQDVIAEQVEVTSLGFRLGLK